MDFAIAKLSTKGQIVIPRAMRKDLKDGEDFLIVKEKGNFILKKMTSVSKDIQEEIRFAEKVEHAWKQYDKGHITRMSEDEFKTKLNKW